MYNFVQEVICQEQQDSQDVELTPMFIALRYNSPLESALCKAAQKEERGTGGPPRLILSQEKAKASLTFLIPSTAAPLSHEREGEEERAARRPERTKERASQVS